MERGGGDELKRPSHRRRELGSAWKEGALLLIFQRSKFFRNFKGKLQVNENVYEKENCKIKESEDGFGKPLIFEGRLPYKHEGDSIRQKHLLLTRWALPWVLLSSLDLAVL